MLHFRNKILLKGVDDYAPLQRQILLKDNKTMFHFKSKILLEDMYDYAPL